MRLAAMMPARRATPRTSPLAAVPAVTSASVAGAIATEPRATARRAVAGLSETSTICAAPRGVEMGEAGHHSASGVQGLRRSSRVAASTFASRISVSPIRKQRTP